MLSWQELTSSRRIVWCQSIHWIAPLLGVQWSGAYYVDGALPFCLRSAAKLFTAMADALPWVMVNKGVSPVNHYLDDFITMGPAGVSRKLESYSGYVQRTGGPTGSR